MQVSPSRPPFAPACAAWLLQQREPLGTREPTDTAHGCLCRVRRLASFAFVLGQPIPGTLNVFRGLGWSTSSRRSPVMSTSASFFLELGDVERVVGGLGGRGGLGRGLGKA